MPTADIRLDAGTQIRDDGETIIVVDARIARVGTQKYGNRTELRPKEEVFSPEHLASIEGTPITIEHPPVTGQLLNETNREAFTVGTTHNVRESGDFIIADLKITNHEAKERVRNGLRGISMGYTSRDDDKSGIFNGEQYDSIQRNMRANHTALVMNPRCGQGCKFDSEKQDDKNYDTIMPKSKNQGAILCQLL